MGACLHGAVKGGSEQMGTGIVVSFLHILPLYRAAAMSSDGISIHAPSLLASLIMPADTLFFRCYKSLFPQDFLIHF